MIIAGHTFAGITATLEDMHAIAVEGQRSDLDDSEGTVLVLALREGIGRLHGLVERAAMIVRRAEI